MPKKLTDDDLRHWLALEFSVEQMAHMARPLSVADVQSRLDALAEADRKAEQKRRTADLLVTERQQREQQRALIAASSRPLPPEALQDTEEPGFAVADDLAAWVHKTFIQPGGALLNPEHEHLQDAHIGFLWTNVPNSRGGNAVAGQAELPRGQGGKWAKARAEYQLTQWFGVLPDFVITLDAHYGAGCDAIHFCALVEHELLHCAQAVDREGEPRYNPEDDRPVFCLRGHDVEEFVSVVRRYGAGAAAGQTRALVEAASHPPLIGDTKIALACGNCLRG